jgi:hypothetical protein
LRIEQQAAAVLIQPAKGSGNPPYVDENGRTAMIAQTCNAQVSGSSGSGGGRKGHQQKADKPSASAPKANDKAYNAALKSLPDKPFDP